MGIEDVLLGVAAAHGDRTHVIDALGAVIDLADEIGILVHRPGAERHGFLADGLHERGADLAFLEIFVQPQRQGRLARVLVDGGNKNILEFLHVLIIP